MTVALLGAPHDANSSFLRGPAKAPDRIRKVLHNGASTLVSEHGFDLADAQRFVDCGNATLPETTVGVMALEPAIAALLEQDRRPLVLGGDHAVSWPILRAIHARHGPLTILHFDAHADIYPDFDANPNSHASPFARIIEERLAARLVQVGIRTLNPVQQEMIDRHGVETYAWRSAQPMPASLSFDGPVYVSLDIDALDPAFAPGVSHHEPGGMSTGDVLDILHGIDADVVGADLVEFNPDRDWQDMTAMVCVKFVKELAGLLGR